MSEFGHLLRFAIESLRMERIVCSDGVSLSVQANNSAYCEPRDITAARYTCVEIGFIRDANDKPVETPAYLTEYADDYTDADLFGNREPSATSDVYAYVPVAILERFIAEHGGRKFYTTFSIPSEIRAKMVRW